MIRVACINCLTNFRCEDHLAGRAVRCPKCNQFVSIPMAEGLVLPLPAEVSPVKVRFRPSTELILQIEAAAKRRRRKIVIALLVLIAVGLAVGASYRRISPVISAAIGNLWPAVPDQLGAEQKPAEPPKPAKPTDAAVLELCQKLIRMSAKHPDSVEFSKTPVVTFIGDIRPKWNLSGRLLAENDFGKEIEGDWSAEIEWHADVGEMLPVFVQVANTFVYQSEDHRKAIEAIALMMGNEASDLPPDVAKAIRNVQASIDDAIRDQGRTAAYTPQWPDDPGRKEFRVNMNQGIWQVTGKIQTFDGRPRREVYGHVTANSYRVVYLKIGDRAIIEEK